MTGDGRDAPFTREPVLEVAAPDGTHLAVFGVHGAGDARSDGAPDDARPNVPGPPPLLLVHGASADHTTFRVVGPLFARSRRVFAMDRRGRGGSSDGPAYDIEREYEDVGAVVDALGGGPRTVDVVGHSYGGRCALGAALRCRSIRRLVAYEGAPVPRGASYRPARLTRTMRSRLEAGDAAGALDAFLGQVVGMSDDALAAYHAEPVWPRRVAAAHTVLREIEAEASGAASLDALAEIDVPVLLVLGSTSRPPFRLGTEALAARLRDATVAVIDGAAHAAHHTHAAELVRLVEDFLDR